MYMSVIFLASFLAGLLQRRVMFLATGVALLALHSKGVFRPIYRGLDRGLDEISALGGVFPAASC